ncbi:prepilin-type N-terminal cleavage/methylation domain-containing protein [bacterium]|nr:prepilin-type N-terminal cleavage/methylation domain-containing protein [bacterium]
MTGPGREPASRPRQRGAAARRLRACDGTTLIEVLVAAAIFALAAGTAYASLIAQIRRHADQMMIAEMLHAGRLAFDDMTAEIANAGFGVPKPAVPSSAPSIVVAEPSRVQFWTVVSTAHTFLTAAAAMNASTVTVLSTAGLKVDATVYLSDQSRWYRGTVQAISGNTVKLTPALTYNFAAGSLVTPAVLVTYELVNGALTRNGRVFIPNVTGLQFTYDAKTPGDVRLIDVSMTVQTRAADLGRARRTVTFGARIAPPNLVL